ncbi:MAG: hypothetical protein HPM95_19250 [Alphaproteobacteria bacterium]|nr:hypothetical protein [Alphaproteobacteria bacterium]
MRTGQDLRAVVETARNVAHTLDGLHSRYDRDVVEQAIIAGALNRTFMTIRTVRARRLPISRAGWTFWRTSSSAAEGRVLDNGDLRFRAHRARREGSGDHRRGADRSADARKLTRAATLQGGLRQGGDAHAQGYGHADPRAARALLAAVFAQGRKGISMQR